MMRPEEIEFIDCPECGAMAEITGIDAMDPEDGHGEVFVWRTYCVDQHHRDNYWYHVPVPEDFQGLSHIDPDPDQVQNPQHHQDPD